MANHGLDKDALPTMQWQWIPTKPIPLDRALPPNIVTDQKTFRAIEVDPSVRTAFVYSFPQLAKQTPDLLFYRLVQIFNTPLLCLDSRDMGRSDFAYWNGVRPNVPMRHAYLYYWFFNDQNDDDLIVAEYGFDGNFTLRAEKKPAVDLQAFYDEICSYLKLL